MELVSLNGLRILSNLFGCRWSQENSQSHEEVSNNCIMILSILVPLWF
jgi:hypothetical protein